MLLSGADGRPDDSALAASLRKVRSCFLACYDGGYGMIDSGYCRPPPITQKAHVWEEKHLSGQRSETLQHGFSWQFGLQQSTLTFVVVNEYN